MFSGPLVEDTSSAEIAREPSPADNDPLTSVHTLYPSTIVDFRGVDDDKPQDDDAISRIRYLFQSRATLRSYGIDDNGEKPQTIYDDVELNSDGVDGSRQETYNKEDDLITMEPDGVDDGTENDCKLTEAEEISESPNPEENNSDEQEQGNNPSVEEQNDNNNEKQDNTGESIV